jgi:hypothetical protein
MTSLKICTLISILGLMACTSNDQTDSSGKSYNSHDQKAPISNSRQSWGISDSIPIDRTKPSSVRYCGGEQHHYVDILAKGIIDSLKFVGIQKILFYRDWIITNGMNGYGKLIWEEEGEYTQLQFNFENDHGHRIRSIDKFKTNSNEPIEFFVENRIDTITSHPKTSLYRISHTSDHFVYLNLFGKENCFNVSALDLNGDSLHLKVQLIRKLEIPSNEYFELLKTRKIQQLLELERGAI